MTNDDRQTPQETTPLSPRVLDAVVIKVWMVPGPGGDVDKPRCKSSYAVMGAPPVVMSGDGLETWEAAALAALGAAQQYLALLAQQQSHVGEPIGTPQAT